MAEAGLSQAALARTMEVSQSSVSHMLTDRSYGLTCSEVSFIEAICRVPGGTLYRNLGILEQEPLEKQVYDIEGINHQAAEAIVAAIQAVRADVLRRTRAGS
jgi:predicted transcriptional regulator